MKLHKQIIYYIHVYNYKPDIKVYHIDNKFTDLLLLNEYSSFIYSQSQSVMHKD